jgi:uncharacterized protein involved in tolerance to divalent cations
MDEETKLRQLCAAVLQWFEDVDSIYLWNNDEGAQEIMKMLREASQPKDPE